jgi:hypothetical protein
MHGLTDVDCIEKEKAEREKNTPQRLQLRAQQQSDPSHQGGSFKFASTHDQAHLIPSVPFSLLSMS